MHIQVLYVAIISVRIDKSSIQIPVFNKSVSKLFHYIAVFLGLLVFLDISLSASGAYNRIITFFVVLLLRFR